MKCDCLSSCHLPCLMKVYKSGSHLKNSMYSKFHIFIRSYKILVLSVATSYIATRGGKFVYIKFFMVYRLFLPW
jgi:hypothetical protein